MGNKLSRSKYVHSQATAEDIKKKILADDIPAGGTQRKGGLSYNIRFTDLDKPLRKPPQRFLSQTRSKKTSDMESVGALGDMECDLKERQLMADIIHADFLNKKRSKAMVSSENQAKAARRREAMIQRLNDRHYARMLEAAKVRERRLQQLYRKQMNCTKLRHCYMRIRKEFATF